MNEDTKVVKEDEEDETQDDDDDDDDDDDEGFGSTKHDDDEDEDDDEDDEGFGSTKPDEDDEEDDDDDDDDDDEGFGSTGGVAASLRRSVGGKESPRAFLASSCSGGPTRGGGATALPYAQQQAVLGALGMLRKACSPPSSSSLAVHAPQAEPIATEAGSCQCVDALRLLLSLCAEPETKSNGASTRNDGRLSSVSRMAEDVLPPLLVSMTRFSAHALVQEKALKLVANLAAATTSSATSANQNQAECASSSSSSSSCVAAAAAAAAGRGAFEGS